MKLFLVVFVLSVQCLRSYGANRVSQGVNDFSMSFLQKVYSEKQNVVFSPTSISMAFGMLLKGARSHTAEEIKQILGLSNINDSEIQNGLKQILTTNMSHRPNLTLEFGNMALLNRDINHYYSYEHFLKEQYQAYFDSVDFVADRSRILNQVNQFVSNKTHGLIQKILNEPLPYNTKLLLINTIYFHGSWQTPFIKSKTRKQTFYNMNRREPKVDTMYGNANFRVFHDRNFTLLELPYEGNVSMYIVLPKARYGLRKVLSQLSRNIFEKAINSVYSQKYKLYVPKFKFDFKPDLKNTLRQLGVGRMFDYEADLSGITSKRKLYLSDAFHKAVIEVDETSTKAAAVTGIIGGLRRPAPPPLIAELRVDHPFLFIIRDKVQHVNLFVGVVQSL